MEIILNYIPFVAAADDEIVESVVGIDFHDMPKNWLAADFNHRLGFEVRFFRNARPVATGQYYDFHGLCYPL